MEKFKMLGRLIKLFGSEKTQMITDKVAQMFDFNLLKGENDYLYALSENQCQMLGINGKEVAAFALYSGNNFASEAPLVDAIKLLGRMNNLDIFGVSIEVKKMVESEAVVEVETKVAPTNKKNQPTTPPPPLPSDVME